VTPSAPRYAGDGEILTENFWDDYRGAVALPAGRLNGKPCAPSLIPVGRSPPYAGASCPAVTGSGPTSGSPASKW
jgi:hypothetical protein